MSFHNPRGVLRQHLNRAQNLANRAKEDEDTTVSVGKPIIPTAKTPVIVKTPVSATLVKVTVTPSHTVVSSAATATATSTEQQFPVPKGTNPFGISNTVVSTSSASSSSSDVASASAIRANPATSSLASSIPSVVLGNENAASTSGLAAAASAATIPPTTEESKGSLSSGAVGAIVALVILAAVGVGAFFARKTYMRRRELKRNTWGAGLVPALETKRGTLYNNNADFGNEPKTPTAAANIPPSPAPIQLPPALYNSSFGSAPPSPFVPPSIQAPSTMAPPAVPAQSTEVAVVIRTFVPNLPDELHISTGEHIRVLNAFDDGWALCANIRNEQGVVPLECLQRDGKRSQMEMQLQPESAYGYDSNRASKRLSSLVPNAAGTY